MDTPQKFSPLTIALHWLIAFAMIAMLAVGFYMSIYEVYPLYDWHKSFGVAIFAVILLRVWWRIKNGWPKPLREYPQFQQRLARVTHWVLIIGTLLMPISGMLYSGLGGWGIKVFGWVMVPGNKNPATGQTEPIHAGLAQLGAFTHEWLGYVLVVTVLLHMAGALKHHLFDRDRTLLRMLGR
ncbi:cytochrome b [Cellvibrio fontiphilus]|uniref:Cytochrome b n=1 Tax=Cellvibrio fontiphilus TaxID=1815559 RepID=A0ABV7FBA5_9GAMM